MYLKELTLRGFKSFASATTLRFEPGITAVVGPNGSGKSNIVDALTWVMGEQGAKNLRGTSMEDVIFAGTSSKPPLGRAQVTLTIDNTDRTLDIDYTEVTISRTIFRNGGSQYAINGSSCRLLDIQELLSDTGLGQQMHVIVGQGRLDAILRADPSGHRAFIEEAAGILKHRKRKERALRKLANTQTNVSRLDDLLHELHRQLGPLGRQARISRRAERIQVSLRDAQARLFAEDACRSVQQRESVRAELTALRGELNDCQQRLTTVKVRIDQVEALSSQSSPAIAQLNDIWRELSQIEERCKSLALLAQERSRSLRGQIVTNFGEDPGLLESRADELETQSKTQMQAVNNARLDFDKAVERRAGTEKQLASIRQTVTELRKTSQERDARIAQCKELIAREESAVQLAQSRINDFATQQSRLTEQLDSALSRQKNLQTESENNPDDGGAALETAKVVLETKQTELNDVVSERRDIESTVISLQAKADALRDTLESRNASGALERDTTVDVLGHVTDFIQVTEGWEEAIAHALDVFASAVVVADSENMMQALERASQQQLGKAVVLVPQPTEHSKETDVGKSVNNPQSAARLVSVNTRADNTRIAEAAMHSVKALLHDVAAVESREEALNAVISGTWLRAVTRQGELFNGVGAIGGSTLSQSDLSLVARRNKASQEVKELNAQLETLTQRISQATEQRDLARISVDKQAQLHTEAQVQARQRAEALKSAASTVTSFNRQISELEQRIAQTREESENHELKLEDLKRALHTTEQSTGVDTDFDELAEREQALQDSLNVLREEEVTAKIAWNDANSKSQSLIRQADLLRDNAREAASRRQRMQTLNEQRTTQAVRVERIARQANALAELVARRITAVSHEREQLQLAASSHDDELQALRAQRNAMEPQYAALQQREHELDVNRERYAASYGQLTQQVSDQLGMSLDELIAGFGPDNPVPVLDDNGQPIPLEGYDADAEQGDERQHNSGSHHDGDGEQLACAYQTVPYVRSEQIARLEKARRDLAALGKINPLATEEYDALEERNQYLNGQRNDVAKSRDDLLQLIRDLDETMVSVFAKAFEDTAEAFERVFSTLFPGGTGRLRLENPEDMLTTGVLVEASPAGKRVKQLSLLSGGERSLTALALLFAIFTARPSPFYVMDEVEAALDDVNLTRLLQAFNALREHAQLIVITHQQRTMSIADALYGVTMRSDGVTAVVSQRLSEHG